MAEGDGEAAPNRGNKEPLSVLVVSVRQATVEEDTRNPSARLRPPPNEAPPAPGNKPRAGFV